MYRRLEEEEKRKKTAKYEQEKKNKIHCKYLLSLADDSIEFILLRIICV